MTSNGSSLALRTGNQMIAEGAISAGCRFFAGYPITPASGIYHRMIELLQQQGDAALSAPDEISALAYCVGASMRGFKSMTATSGPGWALMIETVQYALMTETPVVIALVQRLGPSTGGATQGGQGDVLLAEFCTSGGYTIPVLCPGTAIECYELSMLSFSWAELLRTPVVLLTDKEVGMTMESVSFDQLRNLHAVDRMLAPGLSSSRSQKRTGGNGGDGGGEWAGTYGFAERKAIPLFAPVGGMQKVTATGSAHNMAGELKKNDRETIEVLHHLEEKISSRRDGLALVKADIQHEADTLVISYGITSRAVKEAVAEARRRGKRVSALSLLTLFPVPEKQIRRAAEQASRILVAEENLTGQYRGVIAHLFEGKAVAGVNTIGSMITPRQILEKL